MSTLKVNSIIPVAGVPTGGGGGIIQVVSTTKTDTASSSSASYVDISGMAVTITPSTNTSKIYLCGYLNLGMNDARFRVYLKITGGNCSNYIGDSATGFEAANATRMSPTNVDVMQQSTPLMFLDAPATTSAVTYQIQWAVQSSQTAYLNKDANDGDTDHGNTASTFTAMEVSA